MRRDARCTLSIIRRRERCASTQVLRERTGSEFAVFSRVAAVLGATVDFLHALLMAAWILGLPLLFSTRWPRLARGYAVYAIAFVIVNQASYLLLGECFLTTMSRGFWQHADASSATDEWFTVRAAEAVFSLTPSHRAIKLASEALILATAIGVAFHGYTSVPRARRSL